MLLETVPTISGAHIFGSCVSSMLAELNTLKS